MLHVDSLTVRVGGRSLIEGASIHVPEGARVGLVGRNGAGKTTFLNAVMGDCAPDAGSIAVRSGARVGRLLQEAPEGAATLIECVLSADGERTALLDALETTTDALRLGEIYERLNAIEAHSAPARAARILVGLGFPPDSHERAIGEYSGGWRMRVALASLLFSRPDLLLLDEPTNHLDLEATLWLESHLAAYPGTLLIVSHDRRLLDGAIDRVLSLENRKLSLYRGNYTAFAQARRERLDVQAKGYAKQIEQRRRIERFVERFRYKASKARQAQSRLKMLERMEVVLPVLEEQGTTFDFPDPDPLPSPLLTVEGGCVGYDERPVLKALDFRIDADDRIALLGANGNGKSTLAKLLTGRLPLMEGTLRLSAKARIGYFAQHQNDALMLDETVLTHMARVMEGIAETKVRAHLGRFGFGSGHVHLRVSKLSGGEKARLLIALMCSRQPHLMVLDEPTNHLDMDSREALLAALNAYEGAVVLISHDPSLIEAAADRLWVVEDGTVLPFDGDMEEYRRRMLEKRRAVERGEERRKGEGGKKAAAEEREESRRVSAQARARLVPFKKDVERAEREVQRLMQRRADLEAEASDPNFYQQEASALVRAQGVLAETAKALTLAEAAWIAAMEAYEAARAEAEGSL